MLTKQQDSCMECMICFYEFEKCKMCMTSCNHFFCYACVSKCLLKDSNCPLCRQFVYYVFDATQDPKTDFYSIFTSEEAVGITLQNEEGVIKILKVEEGSPGRRAGLQIGRRVVRVNHVPLSRVHEFPLFVKYSLTNGLPVTLDVSKSSLKERFFRCFER